MECLKKVSKNFVADDTLDRALQMWRNFTAEHADVVTLKT